MKTTSYLISKQLAEAGFAAATEFYWVKWLEGEPELVHEKEQTPALIEKVGAWDLETILEALPDLIRSPDSPPHLCNPLFVSKKGVGYDYASGMTSIRQEKESLADTAARMWLKLKKENLI